MECMYAKTLLPVAFSVCLLTAACNRAPERIPVHGVVQKKGKPLSYGSVMFQPDGGGAIARSTIGPQGKFQLSTESEGDGAAPGTYRVRITAFELQKKKAAGASTDEPTLGRSAIPKKYQRFGTSPIRIDVQPTMQLPVLIDLD